jgi:hypothetical protein
LRVDRTANRDLFPWDSIEFVFNHDHEIGVQSIDKGREEMTSAKLWRKGIRTLDLEMIKLYLGIDSHGEFILLADERAKLNSLFLSFWVSPLSRIG